MQLARLGALNVKRYPKLLILMLAVAVVALSLIFVSVYSEMSSRIRTDRHTLMTQTADFLMAHVNEWLDKNIRVLKTASIQPRVMSMAPESQTDVLQAIAQEYPWIYLVFTLDRNGKNIARSDHGALTDYSDRAYFKALKQGKPLSWQTLIGKTSHKPALVLALPIFRNGIFAGVVAAAMTTESISRSVADWQLGASGFAFLMDEQNKVIAHPRQQVVLEERRMADQAFSRSGEAGDFFSYKDEAGVAKISTIRKNPLGWRLVLEQEKKEAFRELYKFQKFMILVFASIVIMVLGIAWLVARISVTPVIRMIDAGLQREKDLESRLQKVRKMEALGTFAGGIAHDFNNILGAISTCSEMAIEDVDEANPAHEDLKHILRAATRGKKLVKQILEYSRSRNTRQKPVKLHRILLECLDLFKTFKPDQIRLEVKVFSKQDFILADPTQIHQVIMNLLLNAEHAMSGEGTLTITLDREDTARHPVEALAERNGATFLHLAVTDTGCGMEAHVLERMFDPFYTTHMNTGGTGLGLAMSDVIIRRHKGIIFAKSQVDKGSTFHIYLPCIEDAEEVEEENGDAPATLTGTEHILFVDDDAHMIYSGRKMLSRLGYQVTAAENAREALALFRSGPDRFDLVITDRVMPGRTGVELAHDIRQIRPEIPIILCSGFFNKKDDVFLDEAYDLEGLIDETVSKPFDIKGMSMVIRQVLDRGDHG